MAVTNYPFESEFGFKSPGFSVDANGNIIATSIQAAGAGGGSGGVSDYTIDDTPTGFTFTGEDGENPTITLYRNLRYTFNLDLSNHVLKIYSDNPGLTLYNEGIVHSDGSIGALAQGKSDGQIQWSVPIDAPDTLYYGNVDGTIMGEFTILDSPGKFGSLESTALTDSTGVGTGAFIARGGASIGKNLSVGGYTTTTGLDINGLGISKLNATTNLELNAANRIVIKIEDQLLGSISSTGLSIPIVDSAITSSTIDSTPIGDTTPSTVKMTSGEVSDKPTSSLNITNKNYVDNTSIVYSIALGS